MAEGNEKAEYTYPYKSRCPRCRSLRTFVRRTGRTKQYRKCRDCGCKYCVGGFAV